MRIGILVLTSDHRAVCKEVSDVISSEWRAARLGRRRRVFTRRRVFLTSCRTYLGHRCWGSVLIFGATV